MRILVLGAGFGGLEASTRLSEALGEDADVVLVDQADSFVFGYSKLDVMFGRTTGAAVRHHYRDLVRPGVRFEQTTVRAIDPVARQVETDAGTLEGDALVIALGADLDPGSTPGLVEAGHEFYTMGGALAVREVLDDFPGGRVVVGVTSTPFKCPPAPSEAALLVHEHLVSRGLRDRSEITLVMPLRRPIPPSPEASAAILDAFAERGISWQPETLVTSLDPERNVAVLAGGGEIPFDLFLGVPRHRAPAVVEESGLCVDGWVPVDPQTLRTSYDGVYAVGDVTSIGTPKAGMFAERQAAVVTDQLIALARGESIDPSYDGRGICYFEFGDEVAKVEVTFHPGQPPRGEFEAASPGLTDEKAKFGRDRIKRWFGRDWVAY